MINLNNYIIEKLKINKDVDHHKYHPKDRYELQEILYKLINERGQDADLNDIDVSAVIDMTDLFSKFQHTAARFEPHNIDISKWDVSNVTTMEKMFDGMQYFNADISEWDVSKVEDFHSTFYNCQSFNCDLSKWNVKSARTMQTMFCGCVNFKSDLSNWDVSNLEESSGMFYECDKLNFNLHSWKPPKLTKNRNTYNMFTRSGFTDSNIPKWLK